MKTWPVICVAAVLVLGGCSVPGKEGVFRSLNETMGTDLVWIKSEREAAAVEKNITAILARPLKGEDAVRIALINNRSLQQSYEELGIAHADLVQAGLMSNPVLGYSVGRGGGVTTNKLSIELAFLDLLWIPLRRDLAGIALEEAKARIADEVLKTVRETRKAYVDANTAEAIAQLQDEQLASASASAQLAIRQYTAGNLAKRDMLRIRAEYSRARIDALEARKNASDAREELNKLMGLYGRFTDYRMASAESSLLMPPSSPEGLERESIRSRFDIAAARKKLEYAARAAGIVENTRLLDELSLEYENERTTGEARFNTVGVKIPLPLFDLGQGRVESARAQYNQAHYALYALSVNVRSDVRRAYAALRYRYDIAAEYRDALSGIHRDMLEETGLYYNGMLEGIHELLEERRRFGEMKIAAAEAAAEYEKARIDLDYAVGTRMEDANGAQ